MCVCGGLPCPSCRGWVLDLVGGVVSGLVFDSHTSSCPVVVLLSWLVVLWMPSSNF